MTKTQFIIIYIILVLSIFSTGIYIGHNQIDPSCFDHIHEEHNLTSDNISSVEFSEYNPEDNTITMKGDTVLESLAHIHLEYDTLQLTDTLTLKEFDSIFGGYKYYRIQIIGDKDAPDITLFYQVTDSTMEKTEIKLY